MAAARVDRRLAAILAADVVGYSRLIERDEAGTLERLKEHRKSFIEPLIAEHHGRVVIAARLEQLAQPGGIVISLIASSTWPAKAKNSALSALMPASLGLRARALACAATFALHLNPDIDGAATGDHDPALNYGAPIRVIA